MTRHRLCTVFTVFATLTLLPVLLHAHGPTRQKVTETIRIDAPPETVWSVIGDFTDASWLPMVESSDGEGGIEKCATRRLVLWQS